MRYLLLALALSSCAHGTVWTAKRTKETLVLRGRGYATREERLKAMEAVAATECSEFKWQGEELKSSQYLNASTNPMNGKQDLDAGTVQFWEVTYDCKPK